MSNSARVTAARFSQGTVTDIPSHININIYMQLLFITADTLMGDGRFFGAPVTVSMQRDARAGHLRPNSAGGNYDWLDAIKKTINFNYGVVQNFLLRL